MPTQDHISAGAALERVLYYAGFENSSERGEMLKKLLRQKAEKRKLPTQRSFYCFMLGISPSLELNDLRVYKFNNKAGIPVEAGIDRYNALWIVNSEMSTVIKL